MDLSSSRCDDVMMCIEKIGLLLFVLVVLTTPGSLRFSVLSKLRLFTVLGGPRNFFVLEKRLVIMHGHSKAAKFDISNPQVIYPSKDVGKLLFLYVSILLPAYIELHRQRLDKEDKTGARILAEKLNHPFILLKYEPQASSVENGQIVSLSTKNSLDAFHRFLEESKCNFLSDVRSLWSNTKDMDTSTVIS